MHKLYTATDGEVTLTIVADCLVEAFDIAEDAMDVPVDEIALHLATPEPGHRWVRFDYCHEADDGVRELAKCGVDIGYVLRRVVTDGHGDDRYSEVGAHDVHWCMLPSQVLCGGDE